MWGKEECVFVCVNCTRLPHKSTTWQGKAGWPGPATLHRDEPLNRSRNNSEEKSSAHTKTQNCVYSSLPFCQGQSHYSLASSAQLTINWTEHWWPHVSMATTLSKAEPMSRPVVRTSWESAVTQSTVNRVDGISGTQDNKPHSGHDEQTLDKCFLSSVQQK